jgi:hypothetical protein
VPFLLIGVMAKCSFTTMARSRTMQPGASEAPLWCDLSYRSKLSITTYSYSNKSLGYVKTVQQR